MKRFFNYLKAKLKFWWHGTPSTPLPIQIERLQICLACPEYGPELEVCTICWCPVLEKTGMATEQCPLETPRWEKVYSGN